MLALGTTLIIGLGIFLMANGGGLLAAGICMLIVGIKLMKGNS